MLDASLTDEEVDKIQNILQKIPQIKNFHEFRTRASGRTKFVEAHLVFDKNISLFSAHEIAHQIEDKIREIDSESIWSITFHLDPYDDEHLDLKKNKIS